MKHMSFVEEEHESFLIRIMELIDVPFRYIR